MIVRNALFEFMPKKSDVEWESYIYFKKVTHHNTTAVWWDFATQQIVFRQVEVSYPIMAWLWETLYSNSRLTKSDVDWESYIHFKKYYTIMLQ